MRTTFFLGLTMLLASCGPPKAVEAEEVLKNIQSLAGKRVVIRAKFRSGARCRTEKEPGEGWKTYCENCQYCRGPIVLDTGKPLPEEGSDDWPLILGGTYDGQDIRCKGPLNAVECHPFKEGKTYIVQGQIEAQRPPKLLVEKYWDAD
jgi:hypothetical protein